MLTTSICRSAWVDAAGLHISGCTSVNGSTANVPALGPVPALFPTATPSSTPDSTAGWVSYHSEVNHLSFRHPAPRQPVECNGVTAVDNTSATCTPGGGPAATLIIFTDQGQTNYTGAWAASPVSVNGVAGKCFTDTPTTQTPAPNNGPVLAYSSYGSTVG
jgi:hypothetical protein